MSILIVILYLASLASLTSMAILAFHRNARSALHRYFGLTCIALVSWLGSLYVFGRSSDSAVLTLLGRINFASVLFAVTFSFLFVSTLARRNRVTAVWAWLIAEASALAILTVFTPLIDELEYFAAGQHVTVTGPLFLLFAVHVIGFGGASIVTSFGARHSALGRARSQLTVVGFGITATVVINVLTGLLLPYQFGIFAFQEIGALSTVVFVITVAYAIAVDRLLDIRVVILKTLTIAVLIAAAEQVYVQVVSRLFSSLPDTGNSDQLRQVVSFGTVLFIAATFQPVKTWLEKVIGRALSKHARRS